MPTSVGAAGAHAAILMIVAWVCEVTLLGSVADALGGWAPPLFLLAVAGAGMVLGRWFRTAAPDWTLGRPSQGQGSLREYGALVLLALLPAAAGVAYAWVIGAPYGRMGGMRNPAAALYGLAVYVLGAPVVEEFYFRHLLHVELSRLFRRPLTVALANGVWFAAIHAPQNMPLALVTGACCTLLRMRKGSIGLPVAAHAMANLVLEVIRQ
jgi:membrane protease YdiL (CAAX protease family)